MSCINLMQFAINYYYIFVKLDKFYFKIDRGSKGYKMSRDFRGTTVRENQPWPVSMFTMKPY